ncbi:MAG: hypothetical protein M3Z54_00155, partial [Gemmatimonadota bacterium]|nr:hypothetical protein [Gemmatimonadota bacterium]
MRMRGSGATNRLDGPNLLRTGQAAVEQFPSSDIADGVWRAFDRALGEARETFTPAVSREDLIPFLDSLHDSVRCVVLGVRPDPPSAPPSIS